MNELAISGNMTVKGAVIMTQTDIDTFCKELSGSAFCPPNYKGNPIDIKFAIYWGAELGLNAFQSITGIKIINGKPSLHGDILLAVCKMNPQWEDMIESYDEASRTGFCEVRRKGHEPMTRSFSWAQAEKAGLTTRNPVYKSYPERMLQHRARGFALRDMYADSLCGLIDESEAKDYPPPKEAKQPEYDFEADYQLAEIGQHMINNNHRAAFQLTKDMKRELKLRVWALLSTKEKEFIKASIDMYKEEVPNV